MTIANKFPLGSGAGGILGPKQTLEDMYVRYCIEQNYDPDEKAIAIIYKNEEIILIADISPAGDWLGIEFGVMHSDGYQHSYFLDSSFGVRYLFAVVDSEENICIQILDWNNAYYADGWTAEAYLFKA